MSAAASLGDCCPMCGETLTVERELGRCLDCHWREFAPTD